MIIAHRSRPSLLTAAAVLTLAAGLHIQHAQAQETAGKSVALKRTYKTGATEKYSNTTVMEISDGVEPAEKITTTADQTITYGKIEGGTAEIVTVQSNMKMLGPDAADLPPDLLPKESRTTGKIDAQNMMTINVDPAAAGDALGGALLQGLIGDKPVAQGVGLPSKPVAPGEKWKAEASEYEALGLSGALENTFVGETTFEGKAAYRITFEGHFKPGGGGAQNPFAALMGAMTVDITGEAFLDKTDCSILSVTTNSVSNTKMSLLGQNMSMNQKTQQTQKRVK